MINLKTIFVLFFGVCDIAVVLVVRSHYKFSSILWVALETGKVCLFLRSYSISKDLSIATSQWL